MPFGSLLGIQSAKAFPQFEGVAEPLAGTRPSTRSSARPIDPTRDLSPALHRGQRGHSHKSAYDEAFGYLHRLPGSRRAFPPWIGATSRASVAALTRSSTSPRRRGGISASLTLGHRALTLPSPQRTPSRTLPLSLRYPEGLASGSAPPSRCARGDLPRTRWCR